MVMIAESRLRSLLRAGDPPLGPEVIATLARVARAAPIEANRAPLLLRAVGPSVAYDVYALASVSAVSEVAEAAAERARWITTAEAAAVLGVSAHGVRDLLRRGRLAGRKTERGWSVAATSVRRRYAGAGSRAKAAGFAGGAGLPRRADVSRRCAGKG